jgi:excisionase family DNA binding protein
VTEPISLDERRCQTVAVTPKALYRITEVMVLLSMSRTVIYEQIRCGRLRTVKQGASRLVPHAAIAEYVALLERESEERAA